MPKTTITDAPVDAVNDGGSFATMPKDISHVTFYFDATPNNHEDSEFFFAKVDTPGSVNDDLDTWYSQAVDAVLAHNPQMAGAQFVGAAIKFGSDHGGSGGEFYYALDHDSTNVDTAPTGFVVQVGDYSSFGSGVEYQYGDLF